MKKSLLSFEERLGYSFQDSALLEAALRHPSYAFREKPSPFERMEFLGDRVLGCVIAEALYTLFPQEEEGLLATRFVALVRREHLARIARHWQVESVIQATPLDTRLPDSIYADSVEAILGAIYLDGGFEMARGVILSFWKPELSQTKPAPLGDAKSRLQEWTQKKGIPLPTYTLVSSDGPDHNPVFTMSVSVNDSPCAKMALGEGSSHRHAEQKAATALLLLLNEKENQ